MLTVVDWIIERLEVLAKRARRGAQYFALWIGFGPKQVGLNA